MSQSHSGRLRHGHTPLERYRRRNMLHAADLIFHQMFDCYVKAPVLHSSSRQHCSCNLIGQQRQHSGLHGFVLQQVSSPSLAIRLTTGPLAALQGAMFDSAKEAVRQLRDPTGGRLLDQLRAARPEIKSLDALRWGFFGHSVGAECCKTCARAVRMRDRRVTDQQSSNLDTMSPPLQQRQVLRRHSPRCSGHVVGSPCSGLPGTVATRSTWTLTLTLTLNLNLSLTLTLISTLTLSPKPDAYRNPDPKPSGGRGPGVPVVAGVHAELGRRCGRRRIREPNREAGYRRPGVGGVPAVPRWVLHGLLMTKPDIYKGC